VAASPPVTGKITYSGAIDPGQHQDRKTVCQMMEASIGRTIKGFVRFSSPVWRDKVIEREKPGKANQKGLSGYTLSMAPSERFPIGWTLDNVWEPPTNGNREKCADARYSLMTFIGGEPARFWGERTKQERAVAVVEHLKAIFGFEDSDFLEQPADKNYEELDWANEQPGVPAPAAMMPRGILSNERLTCALRAPLGNIHWAASELAFEWCGYMNGAVESGFAAAGEVIMALAQVTPPARVAPAATNGGPQPVVPAS
jgi:monoamine oxidase